METSAVGSAEVFRVCAAVGGRFHDKQHKTKSPALVTLRCLDLSGEGGTADTNSKVSTECV